MNLQQQSSPQNLEDLWSNLRTFDFEFFASHDTQTKHGVSVSSVQRPRWILSPLSRRQFKFYWTIKQFYKSHFSFHSWLYKRKGRGHRQQTTRKMNEPAIAYGTQQPRVVWWKFVVFSSFLKDQRSDVSHSLDLCFLEWLWGRQQSWTWFTIHKNTFLLCCWAAYIIVEHTHTHSQFISVVELVTVGKWGSDQLPAL